jgi:hypothetical protein
MHRLDDLSDRVGHPLGLLLVDLVAAVRIGDVFCVRHELSEPILGLLLRGIGDVAGVRRNVSGQHACRNHGRNLWPPGAVCRQNDQRKWTQRRGSTNLVEAAIRIDPFKGWVQTQAFPYVALHELPLYRPLLRRLRIPKPFGKGVDENETRHVVGIGARKKPDDQTAIGVPDKHVGPRHAGSA